MAIWGSVGALLGAGLGYFFFMDDPENREMPSMILSKEKSNPVNKVRFTSNCSRELKEVQSRIRANPRAFKR